jgi:hypothetical protein
MNQFRKLQKAFTTWKSSLSASSDKEKKHDDYTDAMAYLKERVASEEYKKALMERHPLMNSTMSAQNAIWPPSQGFGHLTNNASTGAGMSAINQPWAPSPVMAADRDTTRMFTVEKVDNGFVLRSGKYTKICKDMEELSNQFVAIMVEAQLDK